MTLFTDKSPWVMHNLMRDFGIGVEDAAAILGNLGHESAGFTDLVESDPAVGGKGGFGWAQWTASRRRDFEAYCARNALDRYSDKANYGFLFTELKGPEKGAIPKLKAAVGLSAKTIAFERAFERAGVKHDDRRIDYAEEALAAYNAAVAAGKDLSLPWAPQQPDDPGPAPEPGTEDPGLWELLVKLYYAIIDLFKSRST